jgi:hypothetical protein
MVAPHVGYRNAAIVIGAFDDVLLRLLGVGIPTFRGGA